MSVMELKKAIEQLSLEERVELNRALYGWTDDARDKQIVADVEAGRLDEIIARAEADLKAGQYRQLP